MQRKSKERVCPICENNFTYNYLSKGLKRKIRKALRILWETNNLMLMCHCCRERVYFWKKYDKSNIPFGWIEDLDKNPIVKKNLEKLGFIEGKKINEKKKNREI